MPDSAAFRLFFASAICWLVGEAIMSFFPFPDYPDVHRAADLVSKAGLVGFGGTVVMLISSLKKK
jgi:hypothetical protein